MPKGKTIGSRAAKTDVLVKPILLKERQKGGTAVKVRHILCKKHGKVMEVMENLKSGIKFREVPTQYSEDKAELGGDLTLWLKLFALPISSMNKLYTDPPGETKFRCHIVRVKGKKLSKLGDF